MTPREIRRLVKRAQEPVNVYYPDWILKALDENMEYISTRLNYYRFLYLLVQHMRPKLVMELGVEYGLASMNMLHAAQAYGGHVIGIDIKPRNTPAEVQDAYDNYHYIVGDTTDQEIYRQVKELNDKYGPMGVIFQDSSHHYAPSRIEWARFRPMLGPRSVWVCDDITPAFFEAGVDLKSMAEYFNELPGTKLRFKDVLHYGNIMGVILL